MKKIAFDIKYRPEIESGEVRVITRIGQSVEIASYNIYSEKGDKFPILALVWGDDNKQHPEYYTLNGRFFDGAESNMDLYLLMETPATTAFEEELSTMIDYSRNHAKADTDVVDIFKDRIFEAARLEVIKGLPHWEKCAEHPGKPGIFSVHVGFVEMGGYEINMGDVFDRLPKYE